MTDEKDFTVDADLGRAYAEMSTEVTPPDLDAKILESAQPSARLSNLLALKPLSWAAITVLSIGLVLELQRSTPESDALLVEPGMSSPVAEEAVRLEMQSTNVPADAAATREVESSPASGAPIAEPVNRSLNKVREAAAETETLDVAPAQPAAQLFEDLDDLQVAPDPERFCDDAETVDAASWYRCVLRLREEGLDEQASYELSLLKSQFPDFEIR